MTNDKTTELEQLFKRELTKFFDSLMVQQNNDPDLIAATTYIWCHKLSDVIGYMYRKILPDEKEYDNVDSFDKYVLESKNLFGILPIKKVDKIRKIWISLDVDDKNNVWKCFKYFVKISEKYKKLIE